MQNTIEYLKSIQITSEDSKAIVEDELRSELGLAAGAPIPYGLKDTEIGEVLFNLGQESGFANGAYACARCHTRGWSIIEVEQPEGADISEYNDYPDGGGAYGPNLTAGIIPRLFADTEALADFLYQGV